MRGVGRVYPISQILELRQAHSTIDAPSCTEARDIFTFLISTCKNMLGRFKVFRRNRTEKSMQISGEITFINKKS